MADFYLHICNCVHSPLRNYDEVGGETREISVLVYLKIGANICIFSILMAHFRMLRWDGGEFRVLHWCAACAARRAPTDGCY